MWAPGKPATHESVVIGTPNDAEATHRACLPHRDDEHLRRRRRRFAVRIALDENCGPVCERESPTIRTTLTVANTATDEIASPERRCICSFRPTPSAAEQTDHQERAASRRSCRAFHPPSLKRVP